MLETESGSFDTIEILNLTPGYGIPAPERSNFWNFRTGRTES